MTHVNVELQQERDNRRSGGGARKPAANDKPSKTLFVINFDPIYTKSKDLERHFDAHGKIANIRIRRNFAFIQYETLEDATRALEATNMRLANFNYLESFVVFVSMLKNTCWL